MKDISARELKGHNILAVERFEDSTRWMIEFFRPASQHCLRQPAVMKCVCFLQRTAIRPLSKTSSAGKIKIKRYARVVEGHILDFKPGKNAATHKPHNAKERNDYVYR